MFKHVELGEICQESQFLWAYKDKVLTAEDRESFRKHLINCPDCQKENQKITKESQLINSSIPHIVIATNTCNEILSELSPLHKHISLDIKQKIIATDEFQRLGKLYPFVDVIKNVIFHHSMFKYYFIAIIFIAGIKIFWGF